MKFGFVTCVQLGLDCLEEIYAIGGKVDLLITLKDDDAKKKSGRIYLDDFARKHKVPLIKTSHISEISVTQQVVEAGIDWLFVIGWSQIAYSSTLSAPKKGCIGIHPTLLPVGRGRAAIPWAIIYGLEATGVTMFKLDAGVDTGPIVSQYKIALNKNTTATSLYKDVAVAHRHLMRIAFPNLLDETISLKPQDESRATNWCARSPDDGYIHQSMSVYQVDRIVRATTRPYPGAFADINGKRFTIWGGQTIWLDGAQELLCRDGKYWITELERRW